MNPDLKRSQRLGVFLSKKKMKKKTSIYHKKQWNIIHKCVAQVSPADFVFSQGEMIYSHLLLRKERAIPRVDSQIGCIRRFVQETKMSNKILMLTMKRKAQQQGRPVGGVPPPGDKVQDSDMWIEELKEKSIASSKVPQKLVDFLRMELETRFDPSLHVMVGEMEKDIWFEIVRKGPVPNVGRLTERDVVARLVGEFGLLPFPGPPDGIAEYVLMDVVKKCVVAFQMLEAEAVVLEQEGCLIC